MTIDELREKIKGTLITSNGLEEILLLIVNELQHVSQSVAKIRDEIRQGYTKPE